MYQVCGVRQFLEDVKVERRTLVSKKTTPDFIMEEVAGKLEAILFD